MYETQGNKHNQILNPAPLPTCFVHVVLNIQVLHLPKIQISTLHSKARTESESAVFVFYDNDH